MHPMRGQTSVLDGVGKRVTVGDLKVGLSLVALPSALGVLNSIGRGAAFAGPGLSTTKAMREKQCLS